MKNIGTDCKFPTEILRLNFSRFVKGNARNGHIAEKALGVILGCFI